MLIIDNIGLKLPSKPRVYDAVIPAWTNAMRAMEPIVSGMAQNIQSPEVLLGLSSWHLCPDMHLALHREKYITQHDALIPKEGLVTLGLHRHEDFLNEGVSWSLPLSRLRYYGRPVVRERTVASSKTRVAFDHFADLALGAAMSRWVIDFERLDETLSLASVLAKICYGVQSHE